MAAGDIGKAVELGELAAEAAKIADDDYCRVRFGWAARANLAIGNRERAEQMLEIGLDSSIRIKNPNTLAVNLIVRSAFLYSQGEFGQAADVAARVGDTGAEFVERLVNAETGEWEGSAPVSDDIWDKVDSMGVLGVIAEVGRNKSDQELLKLLKSDLQKRKPIQAALPPEIASLAIARGFLAEFEEDRQAAEQAYEGLLMYRGEATIANFFPYDRLLGSLASLLDRPVDAREHFDAAIDLCRRAEFRPQLAWTCSDYAETLLKQDTHGDREKITELQDEAIAIATELGMKPLLERVLSQRDILKA